MNGISFEDLYEWITWYHDAQFVYNGTTYVLQPEEYEGKSWLVIWECSDNPHCICRHEIPEQEKIPQEIIDSVLSEKCFGGKSFYEIEKDVTVEGIF